MFQEKLKLRLKVLEDVLKSSKTEKANNIFGFLTNNTKRSSSQPRASTIGKSSLLQRSNIKHETAGDAEAISSKKKNAFGEAMLRKPMWTPSSKVPDNKGKENSEVQSNTEINIKKQNYDDKIDTVQVNNRSGNGDLSANEDMVSGFLYDRLQKEVINLRKCCEQKDNCLDAKDQEIQVKTLSVSQSLYLSPTEC